MNGNGRLSESIQGAIGMIAFDENQQVIDAAGVGKERLGDIAQLSEVPVDDEGFGLAQQKDIEVTILKKNGKTLAIYNFTSS